MIERASLAAFLVGVLVLSFLGGYFVRARQLWPDAVIEQANRAVDSLWELYVEGFALERPVAVAGEGVTVHDPARAAPGMTFLVMHGEAGFHARLVDADGRVVHRWAKRFEEVWDDGAPHIVARGTAREITWHGAYLFPNGDVLFNFEGGLFPYGGGLVRLDRDSNVVFKLAQNTHHSVTVTEDGTAWVPSQRWVTEPPAWAQGVEAGYYEDTVLELAPDGSVRREIPMMAALASQRGLFRGALRTDDPVHLNDIEVVTPELAPDFPMFEPGDLVVSLRNLNVIAGIDPDTGTATWTFSGPFVAQHDPDLLPGGTILVFDNKGGDLRNRSSRVLEIDPATGRIVWQFAGTPERPFFSEAWGNLQALPNGNVLVAETYGGRAFEVTRDAEPEIVWEYVNREPGEAEVGLVGDAVRFPPGSLPFVEQVVAQPASVDG